MKVDIPVVVEKETAEDILNDLKENGRVKIEIRTDRAPNVTDQIEWQIENDQPLLEFVEEYHD